MFLEYIGHFQNLILVQGQFKQGLLHGYLTNKSVKNNNFEKSDRAILRSMYKYLINHKDNKWTQKLVMCKDGGPLKVIKSQAGHPYHMLFSNNICVASDLD
jgi:hypothetical protein